MAVTKIGQIRSTLKAALEYVVDPKKTNGGILTSSISDAGRYNAQIE